MITVEFQSPTGASLITQPFYLDPSGDEGGSEPFRVKHLIAKLVSESVRDFRLRESERPLALLSQAKIDEGSRVGKIGSPREERQAVDLDSAIGQALQAFEDKLYLLFVDKLEKRSLEEIVRLQPDTVVTVIRLTALAGG